VCRLTSCSGFREEAVTISIKNVEDVAPRALPAVAPFAAGRAAVVIVVVVVSRRPLGTPSLFVFPFVFDFPYATENFFQFPAVEPYPPTGGAHVDKDAGLGGFVHGDITVGAEHKHFSCFRSALPTPWYTT